MNDHEERRHDGKDSECRKLVKAEPCHDKIGQPLRGLSLQQAVPRLIPIPNSAIVPTGSAGLPPSSPSRRRLAGTAARRRSSSSSRCRKSAARLRCDGSTGRRAVHFAASPWPTAIQNAITDASPSAPVRLGTPDMGTRPAAESYFVQTTILFLARQSLAGCTRVVSRAPAAVLGFFVSKASRRARSLRFARLADE